LEKWKRSFVFAPLSARRSQQINKTGESLAGAVIEGEKVGARVRCRKIKKPSDLWVGEWIGNQIGRSNSLFFVTARVKHRSTL
jgi:hypothetical protein